MQSKIPQLEQEESSFFFHGIKMTSPFFKGVFVSVSIRLLTFFPEKVFYDASNPENIQTYPQSIRHNLQKNHFIELHTKFFRRSALFPTIGKSFSNGGVVALVENNFPYLSPLQKTGAVICGSALGETLLTSNGESNKVKLFYNPSRLIKLEIVNVFNVRNIITPEFLRGLNGTFLRSSWSSLWTYGGIYSIEYLLKQWTSDPEKNSVSIKAISGLLGAALVQPAIVPVVNLQTLIFLNASQPLKPTLHTFFNEFTLEKKMAGTWARVFHRGLTYMLMFLLIELLKETPDKTLDQGAEPSIALKR